MRQYFVFVAIDACSNSLLLFISICQKLIVWIINDFIKEITYMKLFKTKNEIILSINQLGKKIVNLLKIKIRNRTYHRLSSLYSFKVIVDVMA